MKALGHEEDDGTVTENVSATCSSDGYYVTVVKCSIH